MTEEERYWIGFSVFPGIGPMRFSLLRSYFGSAAAAWHATNDELINVHLPTSLVAAFCSFRTTFSIDAYLEKLRDMHIVAITLLHPKYPKLLAQISDAPFVLYIKASSKIPINLDDTIAVVGTRRATRYGEEVTKTLVSDFVAAGCTIVSGMAYGIDRIAHMTAITEEGKTIAVLGCGVDICAPAENRDIYDACAIGGSGAVVSEMPVGVRPDKRLFPARNRIISGLSKAIVVVEGAEDSGALITARYASDQGRDVFAVPGSITSPMSKAPAKLIRDGAQIVETASDVLTSLGLAKETRSGNNKNTRPFGTPGKTEQVILDSLRQQPLEIDAIIKQTGLTAQEVTASITVLELQGKVSAIGGTGYVINHR